VVSGIEEKQSHELLDRLPYKVVDFGGAGVYNPVWSFYFALDIIKSIFCTIKDLILILLFY
jgi:hypothetical protein